jgi:predicted nucleotidyltransferase component of viral defense system
LQANNTNNLILKKEIEQKALTHQIARSTVDKDWVLGHFIDAIFSIKGNKEKIIFKGGTCLRKCYISNFRFSEDLDFTITDSAFVLDESLLNEIVALVTERTEIALHVSQLTVLKHKEMPTGYAAIVKFWGADHAKDQTPPSPQRWTTSIKIEMIQYEKMLFPVSQRHVTHDYSDQLSNAAEAIPCYDLKEVMSEKLRALIQRSYTAPRDYYDIWFLANHFQDWDWRVIKAAFLEKMKFKNLEFTGIDQLLNEENDKSIQSAWINSLGHQIAQNSLPAYAAVKENLHALFGKIFNT